MARTPQKHLEYFALVDSLQAARCPLCEHVAGRVDRYIDGILFEFVNDVGFRQRLARGGGLCNHHAYQLASKGDALGSVILFASAITVLSGRAFGPRRRGGPARLICPVCSHALENEDRYLRTFLAFADDDEVRTALEASPGFCLPHLAAVVRLDPPPWVLSLQRRKVGNLGDEATRFVDAANYTLEGSRNMDPELPGRLLQAVAGYSGMPPRARG